MTDLTKTRDELAVEYGSKTNRSHYKEMPWPAENDSKQGFKEGFDASTAIHEKEIARLREAALAYQDLSVCYRIGRRPTEKLFKRLKKAKDTLNHSQTEGE